jgi:N-acetylneuraminic acid mutarotase
MKGVPSPLILFVCALRGALFLGAGLACVQPCTGDSGVFENTGSLATRRYYHTATLLPNGNVLVADGIEFPDNYPTPAVYLASAEVYDSANGTWTATGSLSPARYGHTATLLSNGKVLAAGGNGPLASAELYDPVSGTWSATGSLATARYLHAAILLSDGKVLVAGGYNGGTPTVLASAELYDPSRGTWSATGSLATARYGPTVTLLSNGKVLVAGGTNNSSSHIASAELYDPGKRTWLATGSLAIARGGHTATLLPNGKVLVAGGSDSSFTTLATAELYDPASGTWSATGSLATARADHTATLLPNGKVLVAGGGNKSSSSIANAELYDPASGTWAPTGSLNTARYEHTATLLSNGNVLAAGGTNSGGSLASAELYVPGSAPVITSPLTASSLVGQQFTYQFEATGATSLSASNLPSGLTFSTALSAIVGSPTAAGVFPVGLAASNANGTTTATLTITVSSPPSSGLVILSGSSATGRTGQPFSLQVIATGGGTAQTITASALPAGLTIDALTGLISGTSISDNSTAVTLTVTDGNLTTSSILELTFSSDLARPVIVSPSSTTVAAGQFFSYAIDAPANSDPSDPTVFTLIGTLPAGLTFDSQTGTISGAFTGNNLRRGVSPNLSGGIVTNVQLFATNSHGTSTLPLVFFLAPAGTVNIATRLAIGTGDNVLIAGFIIHGNAPKKVMIRALGPSLPVPGAVQDTTLELHDVDVTLGSNDNWRETQENEITAAGIAPSDDRESAIIAILNPGNYSAVVRGKNDATGIAVVEVYDLGTASLDNSSNSTLANIATRGPVLVGDNVMIGGFIVSKQDAKVVVRAIGPSLSAFGIAGTLQDPTVALKDANGSTLIDNDDWQQGQPAEIEQIGLAPADPRESALIATLAPGNYTAIVSGKENATGVALVEVYGLQ